MVEVSVPEGGGFAVLTLLFCPALGGCMAFYALRKFDHPVHFATGFIAALFFIFFTITTLPTMARTSVVIEGADKLEAALLQKGLSQAQASAALPKLVKLKRGQWLTLEDSVTVVRAENYTYFVGEAPEK